MRVSVLVYGLQCCPLRRVSPPHKKAGGGGGGGGHRVACASAETVQCLRSQNSLIIDANTQHSDSRHTQADPNLVC